MLAALPKEVPWQKRRKKGSGGNREGSCSESPSCQLSRRNNQLFFKDRTETVGCLSYSHGLNKSGLGEWREMESEVKWAGFSV